MMTRIITTEELLTEIQIKIQNKIDVNNSDVISSRKAGFFMLNADNSDLTKCYNIVGEYRKQLAENELVANETGYTPKQLAIQKETLIDEIIVLANQKAELLKSCKAMEGIVRDHVNEHGTRGVAIHVNAIEAIKNATI